MGAIYSSEASVVFRRAKRCYIPEDSSIHNHRYENLKPYKYFIPYEAARTEDENHELKCTSQFIL
jgi:hypothetical protein